MNQQQADSSRKLTAVAVEDDAVFRALLRRWLLRLDCEVHDFPNAESALEWCESNHFDIAFIDWMLPGMYGVEMCERLRDVGGASDRLVVIVTSRDSAEDVSAALKSGANDYLVKPLTDREFELRFKVLSSRLAELRWRREAETRAELRLKFSEDLLESLPEAVVLVGADGRVIRANSAVRKFGLQQGEVLGKPFVELLTADHAPRFAQMLSRLLDRDAGRHPVVSKPHEVRIRGNQRSVLLSAFPISFQGSFQFTQSTPSKDIAVITMVDVTALKKAEQKANASYLLLAELMEAIPLPVFYKDSSLKYIGCNVAFEKMLGLPREEILDRTADDVLPASPAAIVSTTDARLIAEGGTESYEIQLPGPDGRNRQIKVHKAVYHSEDMSSAGLIGVSEDITDAKDRERKLAEAEAGFRRVFENSPIGIIKLSADLSLVTANPSAARLFGFADTEQFVSSSAGPASFFADHGEYRQFRQLVAQPGVGSGIECVLVRADGVRVHCRVAYASATDEEGIITDILMFVEDVTHSRMALEALIRSERLAAVGTLAGGVSHEFNNILTGILGYLEMACDHRETPPVVLKWLKNANKAAQRGEQITRNMLAFAAHEEGRKRPTDLNTVVSEVLDIVKFEYERDGVQLAVQRGEVPQLEINGTQIGQAVLVLLTNARQAMIVAQVKQLTVTTGVRGTRAFVAVGDTGAGIAESDLSRIFTPFFSTKGEHAPEGSPFHTVKGAGLGLSVAASVVKEHGGEIQVESVMGQGSVFTILLPLNPDKEQGTTPAEPRTAKPDGPTVMLIDDEELVLSFMSHILTDNGIKTIPFTDPIKAVDTIALHKPDVVIFDMRMPRMDGLTLVGKLREHVVGRPPAFVVTTGDLAPEHATALKSIGVELRLDKPFGRLDLLGVVAKAVGGLRR